MTYAVAFIAAFFNVALRSTQQLNVFHERYWWIPPTSYLMAIVEVGIVSLVAVRGFDWILVTCIGTGSGLGSVTATWLHKRLRRF